MGTYRLLSSCTFKSLKTLRHVVFKFLIYWACRLHVLASEHLKKSTRTCTLIHWHVFRKKSYTERPTDLHYKSVVRFPAFVIYDCTALEFLELKCNMHARALWRLCCSMLAVANKIRSPLLLEQVTALKYEAIYVYVQTSSFHEFGGSLFTIVFQHMLQSSFRFSCMRVLKLLL